MMFHHFHVSHKISIFTLVLCVIMFASALATKTWDADVQRLLLLGDDDSMDFIEALDHTLIVTAMIALGSIVLERFTFARIVLFVIGIIWLLPFIALMIFFHY